MNRNRVTRTRPMDGESPEAWLDRMLENWGVDARSQERCGPEVATTCGSAERHYDIPLWEGEEPPPPPGDPISAEFVERAWRVIPIVQRRVLKVRYVDLPLTNARVKVRDKEGKVIDGVTEPMSDEIKDRIRAEELCMFETEYLRVLREARQSIYLAMSGRVAVDGWVQSERRTA